MAGVYRVYTMTKKSPYLVHFTCEQCGEKNTWIKVFKVDSSYSDRSTFTKAGLKKDVTTVETPGGYMSFFGNLLIFANIT